MNLSGGPAVLVIGPPRYVGPLGVMRSLGRLGVRVYGARHSRRSAASSSRFCAGTVDVGHDGRPWDDDERTLGELLDAGRRLGQGTVLVAGSDEWSVFVARHATQLAKVFRFQAVPLEVVEGLADKDGLYRLATAHGVPTPRISFPTNRLQAELLARELEYPVILKPTRSRPDILDKAVVANATELLDAYRRMEESPDAPNVMFQEYIPGGDSDVWIFNGYFDEQSHCLAAFTGVKLRQHPAKMGIASLGELRHNRAVIDITCEFLARVGYRGIVDIGYRYDARDGKYKVLDINPRLGGSFRIFVDVNGMDVARAMYLDLTRRAVPAVAPQDGRRWINEQADLVSSTHYHRLEGLGFGAWLRSLRGVREGATFALDDPAPFVVTMTGLAAETLRGRRQRRSLRRRSTARVPAGKAEAPVA